MSITLPEDLYAIGESAFRSCKSLQSIIIPRNVKVIDTFAFYSCSVLKSITILGSPKILIQTFISLNSLETLSTPNGYDSLGNYAIDTCIKLSAITIPEKFDFIDTSAFYKCAGLKNITIQTSEDCTDKISPRAFVSTNSVSVLIYENTGFTLINFEAFTTNITTVVFNFTKSSSAKKLRDVKYLPTLNHFTNLQKVVMDNIDDYSIPALFAKGVDMEIDIEKDVESIDDDAFKLCNIIKFTYNGQKFIAGNSLSKASNIQELNVGPLYRYNTIGGIVINRGEDPEPVSPIESSSSSTESSSSSTESSSSSIESSSTSTESSSSSSKQSPPSSVVNSPSEAKVSSSMKSELNINNNSITNYGIENQPQCPQNTNRSLIIALCIITTICAILIVAICLLIYKIKSYSANDSREEITPELSSQSTGNAIYNLEETAENPIKFKSNIDELDSIILAISETYSDS
ncbi:surface antigen BspA-like [Trichomonas vaginalis G3]|uniref:Surface antigen BspA-like n=1 Tax=Trichomonas vaginalis (strain ATCC PRA-98 / G3) TaxID=412133 RepID=A2ESF4_TRIV3|nr:ribonuclease inhibitor domain-containing protein [Trichomonas vaginalis G3]EAY04398.1 surface antigen BspA-like [Trichomonas vaginalis G3]KAI5526345.1 ribonuclease inhibitor domain-containing protein [Trichomonas vaginalis G3]|eukprot:XP_001316621.1 surface antigen BspA-like [Trichomonas vaginalis G3]